jgi:hypothetical protein
MEKQLYYNKKKTTITEITDNQIAIPFANISGTRQSPILLFLGLKFHLAIMLNWIRIVLLETLLDTSTLIKRVNWGKTTLLLPN